LIYNFILSSLGFTVKLPQFKAGASTSTASVADKDVPTEPMPSTSAKRNLPTTDENPKENNEENNPKRMKLETEQSGETFSG